MEQVTFKSSTVWIGTAESVSVYPSLDEVPVKLRLQIVENLQSERAVTILIADKQGRKELVRRLAVQDGVQKAEDTPATEGGGVFFSRREAQLFALVVLIVSVVYFLIAH